MNPCFLSLAKDRNMHFPLSLFSAVDYRAENQLKAVMRAFIFLHVYIQTGVGCMYELFSLMAAIDAIWRTFSLVEAVVVPLESMLLQGFKQSNMLLFLLDF